MNLYQLYLLLAVAAGALIGLAFRQSGGASIKMLLTFSGAYLLGTGVFHILPEVYETHSHHYGIMIMAGFFVQLLLESFSKGLEHGHAHREILQHKGLPIGVLLSLYIHAFLESTPLGGHHDHITQEALLWGLLVHKVPVTIILFSMLREVSRSWWVIGLGLILFALMAPLGVALGNAWTFLHDYAHELMAFVFGMFLHISTTILFESNQSHRFNTVKFLVILLAFAIAWLSVSH